MSKRAILFHGTECDPTQFWYPWLGERLRNHGYDVEIPHYPDINKTPIAEFLAKVLAAHVFSKDTVLIGHSAGSPLVLSILEHAPAKQAILVAGFSQPLPGGDNPILQPSYNWDAIKENAGELIFINSTNDPWGCNDKQGRVMFDYLGGTLIIRNDGHFGSATYGQPYREFPLLDKLID